MYGARRNVVFRAQPLQLAFHGTPKNRFHNLDTKDPRLCNKLHVFIQLAIAHKKRLLMALSRNWLHVYE